MALSTVAVLPATVAEAAPVVVAPVIQPVKLTPYTDYVWQWFISHDGEVYYESFESKEQALDYAKQEEYSVIAECMQQDFRLDVLSGWWILDSLNDHNSELIGEGDGIECTSAQERDLEKMVQQTIEAWVVKHNINIRAGAFDGVQNEITVDSPIRE